MVACWMGGIGSVSGSGWIKTGGEILESVNDITVSLSAIYHAWLAIFYKG